MTAAAVVTALPERRERETVARWCAEHRRPAVVVERTSVELGIKAGNTLRLLECTHPDCRWGGSAA